MRKLCFAICLTLAIPTMAQAADVNLQRGKEISYTCHGCHGITGYKNAYPSYHIPRIAGQTDQYLLNALKDYKAGKRKHATMQAQAASFSDEDLANLAAYLSSIKTK
ncbi:cytochrome c [Lysobacter sp. HDW10]|jgi:cytochrome c553|nr:cytochrome c [Lysobacter sp. HDW10]